jgi:hypothetical protein
MQRNRKGTVNIIPCYAPRRSEVEALLAMPDLVSREDLLKDLTIEGRCIVNMRDGPDLINP